MHTDSLNSTTQLYTVTVPTCMYQVRNKQFSSLMLLQPMRKQLYIPRLLKPIVMLVVCLL